MVNKSLSKKQITKYTKHLQKNRSNYYINSLSNNSIDKLTLNNEFTQTFDNTFSNIIDTDVKPTKQGKSGRCWLFAFTNLLRLHFIKKYNLDYNFQFSQNYLFFYDKLEKCQYFLQIMYKKKDKDITSQSIKYFFDKPITDGGFWNMACNLIKKYGIVPKTNMRDTFQSGNTKKLNFFLNMNLREFSFIIRKNNFTQDEFQTFLEKKMLIIYKILVFFLGTPPKTFTWNYYTKDKKEKKQSKILHLNYFIKNLLTLIQMIILF
jgi:bleomycin hydrolase